MSLAWSTLLPAATVGTDRQPAALPHGTDAIGNTVRQAADASPDPATALLRAAAVLATCHLAGAHGAAAPVTLPAPAAADTGPAPTPGPVYGALTQALFDGPPRLQHEALLLLAHAGLRLPDLLLPQALELGRRANALREPLLPVLGQRGLWLAAQRDDWTYAAGTTATDHSDAPWNDGTLEQRRAWLTQARAADPAAARERLQAALPELPARERADLCAVLATGLSLADEPLLNQLRADRGREVRQAALDLLLRLPDAAHPQRAAARLTPLLTGSPGQPWQIDAPTEAGADWKADQLDAARPKQHALGERAWWLYQLVRQVPLAWWTAHTGLSPTDLLAWAATTDWTAALVRGWADVLLAAPDAAWAHALLDHWPPTLNETPARVLTLLPSAQRDRHLLRGPMSELHTAALIATALDACPPGRTLSADLSAELARKLQAPARDGVLNTDYHLRSLLPDFACAVHPDSFARLTALPRTPDETPAWADTLATVDRIVAARRTLLTLTPTRTP